MEKLIHASRAIIVTNLILFYSIRPSKRQSARIHVCYFLIKSQFRKTKSYLFLKNEMLLIKEKAIKASKQEVGDYLSICLLKLFPDVNSLPSLLVIILLKAEIKVSV